MKLQHAQEAQLAGFEHTATTACHVVSHVTKHFESSLATFALIA